MVIYNINMHFIFCWLPARNGMAFGNAESGDDAGAAIRAGDGIAATIGAEAYAPMTSPLRRYSNFINMAQILTQLTVADRKSVV